jgi:signal transduction histidine kinase
MAGADPKILVVEDELITAHHIKQSLTRLGYEVVGVAASGPAAIKSAEQEIPDLLLADIRLRGDQDGIELAAQFQQRWGVPAIFLTALADGDTLRRAQVTEPYGYLVKPFSADDLHAAIEIALYRKVLSRQRWQASEANARLLERNKEDLYALAARLVNAQEEERKRIARDLHDEAGQQVSLLQMEVEKAEQSARNKGSQQRYRAIIGHLAQLSEELRRISHGLHPAILEDLGLEVALRQLTEEFQARQSIRTRLSVRSVPPDIAKDVALALYRIVQEALTNIARHAGACSVDITLACQPDCLLLFVRDSGRGFDPAAAARRQPGLGLISMRQRAELIGGTLELQSQPGQGTQIVVCTPFPVTPPCEA